MTINSDEYQNVEDYLNNLGLLEEKVEEPTNIISVEPSVVNEKPPAVNSVAEYLNTALPSTGIDLSTISTTKKISYGMEQETTLGYNIYRYADSALDAFLNDGNTEVNLLNAEILRQQEIDEKFPEFTGLHKSQEDMAIMGGRISQNIFDPTYVLFPWARAAALGTKVAGKAGSIASTSTSIGAVTGLESAARQKVLEGEIDLRQVGIEAASGFVGGVVLGTAGSVIAARVSKGKAARTQEAEELIEDLKNSEKTAPTVPEVKITAPDTQGSPIGTFAAQTSKTLEETIPTKVPPILNASENLTGSPIENFAAQATYQKLSGTEAGNLNLAFNNIVEEVGESTINKLGLEARELSATISLHTKIQKRISNYKKELKTLKGSEKKSLNNTLKRAIEAEKILKQDMMKRFVANTEDVTSINMQVIEKLAETGGLTDNLYRTVMGQVTRPIFGAVGGGVIGNLFDEDGTHENLFYGAMLGAGLMAFQKRIQNSKKLSSNQKEAGMIIINDSALEGLAHQTNNLKSFTATTAASKMDSIGGTAKVIGNKLFSRFGSSTDSVEARSIRMQSDYLKSLYTVKGLEVSPLQGYFSGVGEAAKKLFLPQSNLVESEQNNIATIVGELMNGFVDPSTLKAGYKGLAGDLQNVTANQVEKAKNAVPEFQRIQKGIKESVDDVGISYKELDNYLTQVFNDVKIQDNYEVFLRDLGEAIEIQVANGGKKLSADNFAQKISGIAPFKYRDSDAVFTTDESGKKLFRGVADYFENQRQLTDFDARKFLASRGWIDLNAQEALATYGTNTIKVVEFARTFGSTGELINDLLGGISKSFNEKRKGLNAEQLKTLRSLEEKYVTTITNGIEAYWGVYQKPIGSFGEHFVRTLQAAGNMSYLTTVTVSSLPDLLQPFINSGFGVSAKQLVKNTWKGDERFSTLGSFRYENSFERELTQLFASQSSGKYGRNLASAQELWFASIGLKKITTAARTFAYDVGVSRAFTLAKKSRGDRTNLKISELNELEAFGLKAADSSDLKEILKHDNALDAFKDKKAQIFLDIAGRKAADRDAIIPLVGNRLVFSQSRNPFMRAMGQFMSWSMAKTSQLNSVISRVEDGDAQLAIRMIAAVPVYVGIKEFKTLVSPNERSKSEQDDDWINKVADATRISGTASNAFIDKLFDLFKYNIGRGDSSVMEGVAPGISIVNSFVKALGAAGADIAVGDYEGALKEIIDEIPILAQSLAYYKKIAGKSLLTDSPNTPPGKRPLFKKGGEVTYPNLVPNAPLEPDERIDKITGLPYNEQAGIAFIDEEDPLKRLGLVGGGSVTNVDPLERMGFGRGRLAGV